MRQVVFRYRMQQGYTLIELMSVLAIIGILAAAAIPAYQDYAATAKVSRVLTAVDPLKSGLAVYALEHEGSFATFPGAVSGSNTSAGWSALGFSGPPSGTAEVQALSIATGAGVIYAKLDPSIDANQCTLGFTQALMRQKSNGRLMQPGHWVRERLAPLLCKILLQNGTDLL